MNWKMLATLAVALMAAIAMSVWWTSRREEDAQRLATIRAALADYVAAVQVLAGRYEDRIIVDSSSTSPGQFINKSNQFVVDLAEPRIAVESHEIFDNGGAMLKRQWRLRTFDRNGHRILQNTCCNGGDVGEGWGQLSDLLTSNLAPNSGDFALPTLCGLPLGSNFDAESVTRLLESGSGPEGSIAFLGQQTVNGGHCERLVIMLPGRRYRFWLDPAKNYLPRRQEFQSDRHPPYVVDTFDFIECQDETNGGSRWIPAKGTIRSTTMVRNIELTEIRLNHKLDPTRYRIDVDALPDGIRIVNEARYTGNRQDLWEERQRRGR